MLGVLVSAAQGQERLDFWGEGPRMFGRAEIGGDILLGRGDAIHKRGRNEAFCLDYVDKRAGDFSVVFRADAGGESELPGFTPGPYRESWSLGRDWQQRHCHPICTWYRDSSLVACTWVGAGVMSGSWMWITQANQMVRVDLKVHPSD